MNSSQSFRVRRSLLNLPTHEVMGARMSWGAVWRAGHTARGNRPMRTRRRRHWVSAERKGKPAWAGLCFAMLSAVTCSWTLIFHFLPACCAVGFCLFQSFLCGQNTDVLSTFLESLVLRCAATSAASASCSSVSLLLLWRLVSNTQMWLKSGDGWLEQC